MDIATIDEKNFPSDFRIKSNYYRFYAGALQIEKDFPKAESFIERAISLNPDRVANYIAKLGLLVNQFSSQFVDIDKARMTT